MSGNCRMWVCERMSWEWKISPPCVTESRCRCESLFFVGFVCLGQSCEWYHLRQGSWVGVPYGRVGDQLYGHGVERQCHQLLFIIYSIQATQSPSPFCKNVFPYSGKACK